MYSLLEKPNDRTYYQEIIGTFNDSFKGTNYNMGRTKKKSSKQELNQDKWPLQPLNDKQEEYMDAIDNYDLVFGVGFPGTAKSLIALYKAFEYFDDRNCSIDKIVVIRNIVDADGSKSVGALPGTLEEKIEPLMRPIYRNLKCFMTDGRIDYIKNKNQIEFIPYEFLRGESLNDTFIICEEAQNFSSTQMYTVLTRIGERSKMVVNGDYHTQRDLQSRYGVSGLQEAVHKLMNLPNIGLVVFDDPEYIVRSGLVKDIVVAYYGNEKR